MENWQSCNSRPLARIRGRRRGPGKSVWRLNERRNSCISLLTKLSSRRLLEGRTHKCEDYIQMCVSELHYGGISAGAPCSAALIKWTFVNWWRKFPGRGSRQSGEKLTVNSKIWCSFSEFWMLTSPVVGCDCSYLLLAQYVINGGRYKVMWVNHLYFPTNALNCIKLIRLKSTCINILKDN